LIPALTDAQVPVVEMSQLEYAQACGMFYDLVVDGGLRHSGQAAVDASVRGAVKRPSGDSFMWDRRKAGFDLSPLIALTNAAWGFTVHGNTDLWGGVY